MHLGNCKVEMEIVSCCTTSYHCSDFDFEEWAHICSETKSLLPIESIAMQGANSAEACSVVDQGDDNEDIGLTCEAASWDEFYSMHSTARVYQARKYIYPEFRAWIDAAAVSSSSSGRPLTVVEAGCGHGCTMFPILEILASMRVCQCNTETVGTAVPWRYVATDCSEQALQLVSSHPLFEAYNTNTNGTIELLLWNCEQPFSTAVAVNAQAGNTEKQPAASSFVPQGLADLAFCIFTLSAVDPIHHVRCFSHIHSLLAPGGALLFRDYAIHDMTMYRHSQRVGELLFRRPEGTLAYYFDEVSLVMAATAAGFEVKEVKYACVEVKNRSGKAKMAQAQNMRRVFIHAVFVKPCSS